MIDICGGMEDWVVGDVEIVVGLHDWRATMIYHCTKCHHEWMTVAGKNEKKKCDWCRAKGKPIGKDYTDRPEDCRMDLNRMLKAWKNFFESEGEMKNDKTKQISKKGSGEVVKKTRHSKT